MTLERAIEILALTVNHSRADNTPLVRDAVKLGIEAMKWRQRCEATICPVIYTPLPGETLE